MSLLHPKTRSLLLTSVLALAAIVPASRATAAEYQVLHDFPSGQNDGADPYADVIFKHGNLYGTTAKGGGNSNAGTVFRIAPDGSETVLYSFSGKADGNYPYGITLDRSTGDIYGVTGTGGVFNDNCASGCGVIYKLTREGAFRVLHSFTYSDGKIPVGRLIRDA